MSVDAGAAHARVLLFYVVVILWGGAKESPAQSVDIPESPKGALETRLVEAPPVFGDPAASQRMSSLSRFGRALGGSTVGVAVGTGLGLLLWRAAAAEGFGKDWDDPAWRNRSDTGDVLFGMGLVAIAAGGPVGAVAGAGLEKRRRDAYVVGGVGEVVLGGLGYGLVRQLDGNASARLVGLGVGAALGAAVGTALVASQAPRGAVAYQNGSWTVAPPEVHVWPALTADRSPSIRVTLVSVRL